MKGFFKILASIIIVITISFAVYKFFASDSINSITVALAPKVEKDFTVSKNGWLHVDGTKLKNEKGQIIQLSGISSHGLAWYGDLVTHDNLKKLKEEWGINTFRVSMYSENYVKDKSLKEKAKSIINNVIDLDMYVIIDWHILNDSNPNTHYEEAKQFFDEVSKEYAEKPNVIYEICNEPNGNAITWEDEVKPYAEKIIPVIRENSPKSLIIVGTPDWCKKVNKAADDPLNFENIAYACHFYAATHKDSLRETLDYALEKNLCIFVSECGLSEASGNGTLDYDEFDKWINYLNEKDISFIIWSFSNKNENSAILAPNYTITGNSSEGESITTNINDHLTDNGNYIKNLFNSRKK